ncbi:hypothetical protein AG1IA_09036 [Rhizoctonia solani AG-1 IA]|uniref:Uncharacterized protein n=1 Tax=Thanatephorus cucumeris (strain AG1-IA) TaxID=983506 RepID=L8WJM0_THACA|nr:hypothetical protein AG1IA_09036 [Rhizoctonia solani AG-1 IA]
MRDMSERRLSRDFSRANHFRDRRGLSLAARVRASLAVESAKGQCIVTPVLYLINWATLLITTLTIAVTTPSSNSRICTALIVIGLCEPNWTDSVGTVASPPPRRLASSPRQLSIVMDGDENTPSTSRMTRSNASTRHSTGEDLDSSRSTIPFPSAQNESNNDRPEESQGNFSAVIQALRSIVQTPPPSDDGRNLTPVPPASPLQSSSTPQLATPLQVPKPSLPAYHSPSEDRIRRMSSPLKPSLSNVDSLASSRHDGAPKKVSFDHASSGPTVSMQNLTNGTFASVD